MSRIDSNDYEYPPGIAALRNGASNGEREYTNGFGFAGTSGAFGSGDRRAYGVNTGGFARAMGGQEKEIGFGSAEFSASAPNRSIPAIMTPESQMHSPPFSSFNHHHHHPQSSPPNPQSSTSPLFYSSNLADRERQSLRFQQSSPPASAQLTSSSSPASLNSSRSTIWWGELEPWMDEEYAKQVCGLMGWDPVNIKVPHPPPDPTTGQQPNNPGYCFLTFPSPAHAATVLAQVNNSNGNPPSMPNSTKPFVLNWASSVPTAPPAPSSFPATAAMLPAGQQQYPKEYSIFVGDLAPETSNSDLVAVFRNPVLGLRNDREPKFIRPFLSCKSAKIMLDPVTGVSRGYGFVRFTDEADQQRALIEMHGLYCLSRPMRISPATAKFKPPQGMDMPQVQFPPSAQFNPLDPQAHMSPPSNGQAGQAKSVSAPIAAVLATSPPNLTASGSGASSLGTASSNGTLSSGTGSSTSVSTTASGYTPEEMMNLPTSVLAQIAQQYANGTMSPVKISSGTTAVTLDGQPLANQDLIAPRYLISEQSWKHHAQARAILGNLIGPNGEQLTSTDPYNTTVFVGGLSPLISEETLRTFFAPFGDIHYVKVPVGKHCGFVQFVRKADAERAIEKMQGFPIGGSRIRLSWGRSQCMSYNLFIVVYFLTLGVDKAAQAAAQAAQAAAVQAQIAHGVLSDDRVLHQWFQKMHQGTYPEHAGPPVGVIPESMLYGNNIDKFRIPFAPNTDPGLPFSSVPAFVRRDSQQSAPPRVAPVPPSFSPFSPDPNVYPSPTTKSQDSQTLRSYQSGYLQESQQPSALTPGENGGKVSPTSTRPSSASHFQNFLDSTSPPFTSSRGSGRTEGPISRPASRRTSTPKGDHEQDIQDLNGTLASLELDQSWKSPGLDRGAGSSEYLLAMKRAASP
ncbi:hypothetical protein HGRIS_009282 [Hohenbuehelia grisea]|uniref:RRM domain-containing protein n=1 Tax=Hohenbuehelia grisea TaxID=104357 RepID=A0ABR3J0P5_9AGAR